MKYIISKVQERTSAASGKKYKTADFDNGIGAIYEGVSVFDKLETIVDGAEVEGEIKDNGKWKNFQFPYTPKPKGAKGDISAAQDRKEKSIKESMDRKEWSIMCAGAQRDATLIVTTLYPNLASMPEDEREVKIMALWKKYRDRFINEFDKDTATPF